MASVAYNLYKSHTMEELVELLKIMSADPENLNPDKSSIYIHTKKARQKMDAITWAITWKLKNLREKHGESVLEDRYFGYEKKVE